MELKEAIYTRRAVRAYDAKPLPKETVESLLQAAVQAPSAMNQQPWAFVIIQGAELLRQFSERAKASLLESMDSHSPLHEYRDMLGNPDFDIFYGAGTLIVICAKSAGLNTAEDCCLAAQNLMLAACDLGLGSCPIGFARQWLSRSEIKEELGIPSDFTPIFPVIVGYPKGEWPPVARHAPPVLAWITSANYTLSA
jgi:nitroreductase